MTQIKYEKIASSAAIIQQQFELPQQMIGIVNYQVKEIIKIVDANYEKTSLVQKSLKEWDKIHDNVDFKDLVSHFQCDYQPQQGEAFNNPFSNLEDRYLSDDDLQNNPQRFSGYN